MAPGKTESARKIKPPEITTLGEWPSVEDAVRQMGRDRGVPPEEIETFLEDM